MGQISGVRMEFEGHSSKGMALKKKANFWCYKDMIKKVTNAGRYILDFSETTGKSCRGKLKPWRSGQELNLVGRSVFRAKVVNDGMIFKVWKVSGNLCKLTNAGLVGIESSRNIYLCSNI